MAWAYAFAFASSTEFAALALALIAVQKCAALVPSNSTPRFSTLLQGATSGLEHLTLFLENANVI